MHPDSTPSVNLCRRQRFVAGGLFLAWLLLAGRLVQLHLASGPEFERLAARQRVVTEKVPARPGDIVDRHGEVLATSVAARSLFVVPSRMRQGWHTARAITQALELDADALFERIAAHPDRQFLWVQRRLSDEQADRIRALRLPAGCWGFREEFRRLYPQGTAAAQVIGLRDIDGVGRGGVEQSLQEVLRGQDGARELVQDALGKVLEVRQPPETLGVPGRTARLTLDVVIQVFAEQALDRVMDEWKPKSACAIVLDPRQGEVLALASRPTFDPNRPHEATPEAWKCRALADIYEPGSTFKPFVVAAALERGCIGRDDVFDCENGEYRMGRRVLHDHHRYGRLSVADILVKSSNIGMAKIGQRLGNRGLHEAARAFGFGAVTGIELPGELPGILRPLKQWNSYSTGSVPMGQELAATPLQVITAYAALSNGGRLIAPRLRLAEDDSALCPIVSQAVDPQIADWVRREALTAVVVRGTGRKAMVRGYDVFGKTGTAQKPDPQTGEYSRRLHVSSFVCGAPADEPRALVLVSVDEPSVSHNGEHFGGSVAAPAAGELLRRVLQRLGVAPSRSVPQTAILLDELDGEYLE